MATVSEWLVRLHFLLLVLLCCVSPSSCATIKFITSDPLIGLVGCHPHQIKAFTQFKNEFDARRCNHNYNGIWCNNSTGAVTKLRLRGCLTGTLKSNSSLFQFHHLRFLDLSHNNFASSSLPSEFGYLTKLEVLSLSFNGLTGQVPSSFSNLSMLSKLDLSQNDLTGSFPLVRNLTKLTVLDLSHNHFSGTLYPNNSLFELHHLLYLNLAFNNFNSSISVDLSGLHNLERFIGNDNSFFGPFPSSLLMISSLGMIALDRNQFEGPLDLGNMSSSSELGSLDVSYNKFSGLIPPSIWKLRSLAVLDLSHNSFKGIVPRSISSLVNLTSLDLSYNKLEGQIPSLLWRSSTLWSLYLSHNMFIIFNKSV